MVAKPAAKLTYEDYRNTPEDARHELLDGELLRTAAPNIAHQRVSGRLEWRLRTFVEERGLGEIFDAPTDVVLSDTDVVQPDILFVSKARVGIITADDVRGVPDLVVEVLSPSTARRDWRDKLNLYSKHGVREFWLVGRVGRRRVTPCYRSTFPSAPLRTGRAAFTASGSPVSMWVVSVKANTAPGGAVRVVVGR